MVNWREKKGNEMYKYHGPVRQVLEEPMNG